MVLIVVVGLALRVAGAAPMPQPACRFIQYFEASGYSAQSVSLWERVAYSLILASSPEPKPESSGRLASSS